MLKGMKKSFLGWKCSVITEMVVNNGTNSVPIHQNLNSALKTGKLHLHVNYLSINLTE